MTYRSSYPAGLIAVLTLACGTAVTEPGGAGSHDQIRSIQITSGGVPLGPTVRVVSLGSHVIQAVAVYANGERRLLSDAVTWGSTQPGVAETFATAGLGYISVRRNGRANIIAQLGELRDTVTFEIQQVAVSARVVADTLVALTPDAVDVASGAPQAEPLLFSAFRADANGFAVESSEPIAFEVAEGAPFRVSQQSGDAASIIGTGPGSGRLFVKLGDAVDTVVVQVAEAFQVIRFAETPGGTRYASPDTAHVSPGTAVIFQNDAPFVAYVGDSGARSEWRAGPIPINGREAQLFTAPQTYPDRWAGGERAVVVRP